MSPPPTFAIQILLIFHDHFLLFHLLLRFILGHLEQLLSFDGFLSLDGFLCSFRLDVRLGNDDGRNWPFQILSFLNRGGDGEVGVEMPRIFWDVGCWDGGVEEVVQEKGNVGRSGQRRGTDWEWHISPPLLRRGTID